VRKLQLAGDLLRSELEGQGFDIGASSTQIIPLMVGDAGQAMRACELALEQGVFAQAIRPPTVAAGTSRLRLAVMASHTKTELRTAGQVLGQAMVAAGLAPKPRPVAPPVTEPAVAPEREPEPVLAGGVFDGEAVARAA
jgi:glycine C-acetyltransferase/8-amino-7-oxononanoate synthase